VDTVLAGDLGGTKCRFALVAADFGVHAAQRVATERDRPRFLARLEEALAAARAGLPPGMRPPAAIGIGAAGVMSRDGRTLLRAPNLPLDGFALVDHLERRFGLPAVLLNDGRASAWGEFLRGHAQLQDPLLCLFFGTGIGIGLMVGGRPYAGADNAAGEIGHTLWRPGGRVCACGGRGHFEAYCAGRAITERAGSEIGPRPGVGAWDVGAVAAHDSAAARAILEDAAAAAAAMVANACTLLNPRAVVLGGGVLQGWPELRHRIERGVHELCSPAIADGVTFAPSLGGSDAVLWGAAAAAGLGKQGPEQATRA
jgi:glucokinase